MTHRTSNLPPSLQMVHLWPTADKLELAAKRKTSKYQDEDPVKWIQSEFYIPELTGPIKLFPYQVAVLREAFSKDSKGNFNYNLIVWSDIKKSSKSCIAAAVAFYRAYHTPWAAIRVIANDLKQADSRVAFYLRRAIQLNPRMKDYIKIVNYKITFPNYSTIEAVPIDPAGEAGGNDDLIIFSELWAAQHKAIQRMWTEATLSPTKFGKSQRWIETYAGFNGESPILERLYDRGKRGEKLDLSYTDELGQFQDLSDLEVYREGGMLMLWNDRPRLPFQTPEYYHEERETLLPTEFARVHENSWVSSIQKFVEKIWWEDCYEPLPGLTKREMGVLGVDAAKGGESTQPADCFAAVLVTRHPQDSKRVAVRYCGIWQAEKGKLLDYEPIEKEIKRICKEFSIIEVAYDPLQLHDMMTRIKKEAIANTKEFSQGAMRLKADKDLRDLIINKRIVHDGNPLLTDHIDNANVENHGEEGIRIVKRSQDKKVDAAVALAMATMRCQYYNL